MIGNCENWVFLSAINLKVGVPTKGFLMRKPERVAYIWTISASLRFAGLELLVYSKSFFGRDVEDEDENENDAWMDRFSEFEDVLDIHLIWKTKKETEEKNRGEESLFFGSKYAENSI